MRGVFQVRAPFGYTVMVDDVTIPMDLSWTDADALTRFIAALRFSGDGRGAARCRHPGNDECFRIGRCFHIVNGEPSTRSDFVFHYDTRPADYWVAWSDDDRDPGDEDFAR